MRSLFRFSPALLAILILAACPNPATAPGTGGSLSISISDRVSMNILPGISMVPASYTITGSGPGGSTFSQTITGSSSATVNNLAFGSWTVTATANNASGTPIGSDTQTTVIHTNATTTLALSVVPFTGLGTLSLSLTWNPSDLDIPQVTASLLPTQGSTRALDFTVDAASGTATFSASDVASGYYTLVLKLLDNGATVMGAVDVVRIVKDASTTGSFAFMQVNKPGGGLAVNITPNLGDPLTVSISGASATKPADQVMALGASIAETGVNATYVWYVNGDAKGTGPTFSFDTSWAQGYYRIDVTAFSADGKRAGSATASVQVVGPTGISVLTGPATGTMGGQRAYDSHGNVYLFTYEGGLYKVTPAGAKTMLLSLNQIPGSPNGLLGSPLVLDDNHLIFDTGVSGVMELNLTTLALTPYAPLTSYYYGISNMLLDQNGIIVAGRTQTLILPGGAETQLSALSEYMVYTNTAIYKSESFGIGQTDLSGNNHVLYTTTGQYLYGIAMGPDGSVYAGMGSGITSDPITIFKLVPGTGTVTSFVTLPNWIDSLVSDGGNNLYAAGFFFNRPGTGDSEAIFKIDLTTGAVTEIP